MYGPVHLFARTAHEHTQAACKQESAEQKRISFFHVPVSIVLDIQGRKKEDDKPLTR